MDLFDTFKNPPEARKTLHLWFKESWTYNGGFGWPIIFWTVWIYGAVQFFAKPEPNPWVIGVGLATLGVGGFLTFVALRYPGELEKAVKKRDDDFNQEKKSLEGKLQIAKVDAAEEAERLKNEHHKTLMETRKEHEEELRRINALKKQVEDDREAKLKDAEKDCATKLFDQKKEYEEKLREADKAGKVLIQSLRDFNQSETTKLNAIIEELRSDVSKTMGDLKKCQDDYLALNNAKKKLEAGAASDNVPPALMNVISVNMRAYTNLHVRLDLSLMNRTITPDGIKSIRVLVRAKNDPEVLLPNNRYVKFQEGILIRNGTDNDFANPDVPSTWKHVLPLGAAPFQPLVLSLSGELPWGVNWPQQGAEYPYWEFILEVEFLRAEKLVMKVPLSREKTQAERFYPKDVPPPEPPKPVR
jgi:hypothetical protein